MVSTVEEPIVIKVERDQSKIAEAMKKKRRRPDVADTESEATFTLSFEQGYKIYESIWRNMDRENNLVNQRISWCLWLTAGFLTAQTFMLGAVSTTMLRDTSVTQDQRTVLAALVLLCSALSALACIFCAMTIIGVQAAHNQIDYLKRRYERLFTNTGRLFQDHMRLPRPFGHRVAHLSGNIVAKVFPITMAVVWAIFCALELRSAFMIGNP